MKTKKDRISSALRNRLRANGVKNIDSAVTLEKVYEKYSGICQGCFTNTVMGMRHQCDHSATMEHIVPISRGGDHTWENVSLLCFKCNQERNNAEQKRLRRPDMVVRFFGYEIRIAKVAA